MSLITSIAELKNYITIDANSKMVTFLPFIKDAERVYLKPLLGSPFYAEFSALYDARQTTPLTADSLALLDYIQKTLANYAAYSMVEQLGIVVGELGILEQRSDDASPAQKWRVRDVQVKYILTADRAADDLLGFLEEKASDSVYSAWYQDETANTAISGTIVYSTAIASQYIDINDSRRLFLRLRKKIVVIERKHIPRLIGQDQYDALVTQLKERDVTPESRALLDLLEPIIAKKALALTIPFLRLSLTAEGIHLLSSSDSVLKQEHASKDDIKALVCSLTDQEDGYLADEATLRQFILDNIGDYPLIETSAVYTVQPNPGPTWVTINDRNNKHFGV